MDVITKFLDKYSYRFPKGYPDLTDPADKKLMQELLSGIGISEAPETGAFTSRRPEQPNGETKTYYQILKDAGLDDKILGTIGTIFNKKYEDTPSYLDVMSKNFRKYSISDVKVIFEIFKDYIDISDKGLGRGEIATIMGTTDTTSGGTTRKDIITPDGEYDVKELTSRGEFRTASGGYITTSKFKKSFDYLLSLFNQLRGKNEDESSDGTQGTTHVPEIDKQIDKLLNYYLEGGYKSGGLSGGTIDDVKKLCNTLNTRELTGGKINKFYVKVGNKKFTVDQETYEKIQGGEKISNITLGDKVEINDAILTKIKEHPWVKNPDLPSEELDTVWKNYFSKGLKGLILVDGTTPTLYTTEELLDKFTPYRIVQNQINIIEKTRLKAAKIKEDLDEDEDSYND
jgi:hypothetical protein